MKIRILLFAFVVMFLLVIQAQATPYKRYSFKVFLSQLDEDMCAVGPSDNDTLSMHYTYMFSFYRAVNGVNYTIRYNETQIASKPVDSPIIIFYVYTNNTEFNINVIKTGVNGTEYITIHYYAKPEPIPIIEPTPPLPEETNPSIFENYSTDDILQMTAVTILLIFCMLPLIGFTVKRYKEHRTDTEDVGTSTVYYRARGDETQTKIWQGSEK